MQGKTEHERQEAKETALCCAVLVLLLMAFAVVGTADYQDYQIAQRAQQEQGW